ncbi:MAG: hypothetical protein IJ949_00340, partial [Oscillospiraceae bacterium]|nr:hypothetical protein [Oscillospiraceae bacterium]
GGNIRSAVSHSGNYVVDSIDAALALTPPEVHGFYKVSYEISVTSGVTGYMGVMDASKAANVADYIKDCYELSNVKAKSGTFDKVIYSNGSDELVYAYRTTDGVEHTSLKLSPVEKSDTFTMSMSNNYLYVGDTVTPSLKYGSYTLTNGSAKWRSTNTRVVTIDENTGELAAVGGGRANIYAEIFDADGNVNYTATKTVRVYQPEYVEAFGEEAYTKASVAVSPSATASIVALDGSELEATIKEPVYDEKTGTYSVSAPETIGDYNFRYWIKGLELKKQIVSLDNDITAYTPHNGPNYLIAVYDKAETTSAETEFYNANGQKLENGDTLPYMAGYGQAKGWIDHKNGVKEAYYGEPNTFTITVDDARSEESKVLKPKYGELVKCETAAVSGETFIGWFKTVNGKEELVGTDMTYSFYAWENCTVTARHLGAVNEFVKPSDMIARRILLGTFDIGNGEQAIMAEFIGFDNAVERGITIGTKDYAMTQKDASQFTIINDVDTGATISGYAILAGGIKYIYTYTAPETAE